MTVSIFMAGALLAARHVCSAKHLSEYDRAQKCSIDNLHSDLSFLDGAEHIAAEEYLERRDRLARALAANGVDAFVVEPGYTFQYVPCFSNFPY